jgi:membrane protein required for colicin V production
MSETFNTLDLIFIAFTLIFVATAFFRGFIKEIFALIGWILAFVGSYFLTPYLSQIINSYSQNNLVADLLARTTIFIIIFLGYTFSIADFVSELKDKMPKAFDRSLGVFYGLIKTVIVFGVFYSIFSNALEFVSRKPIEESSPQFPKFLKEARCHDIIKGSADVLNPAVTLFFDAVVKNFEKSLPKQDDKDLNNKINEIIEDKKNNSADLNEPAASDLGYNKKDIEKMNHLIEIIEKK